MTEEQKKKKKPTQTTQHKDTNQPTNNNKIERLRAWELSLWGSDRCEMHSGSAFE